MRKKDTSCDNWIQKTFRVRSEAINLYKYLEFYGVKNNISKDILFDMVVNYSLDYIEEKNPTYIYDQVEVKRLVKGFTFKEDTFERLLERFKIRNGLKKGEVIEILIGLYALNHLNKEELEQLDIYIKLENK